jgi:hypothetical protein
MRFFQFNISNQPIPAAESVGCYERAIAYFSQQLLKKLDLLAVIAGSGSFPINIPVLRAFVCESLTFFPTFPLLFAGSPQWPSTPVPAAAGKAETRQPSPGVRLHRFLKL